MRQFEFTRRRLLEGATIVAGLSSLPTSLVHAGAKPVIMLSSSEVNSGANVGDVVASLSVADDPSWTFSLADSFGGSFAIVDSNLVVNRSPLDHERAAEVTIRANKGDRSFSETFALRVRQPLPRDSSSLTFASNRVSFPIASQIVASGDCSALGHTMHIAPDYGASGGIRLLFCNYYVDQSGDYLPEKKPGSHKSIDFATVFVDDVAYPVTFDGADNVVIPDGGFIWSDAVMNGVDELTLAPRAVYYVRVSETTPVGKRRVFNAGQQLEIGRWANWSTGEGVEYSSAPRIGKRTSGKVSAYRGGSVSIAPNMIVAKGWDGSAVYALFGDSIGAAVGDFGSDLSNRGVLGYIGRALDDTESGRRSFANFCVPGTKPQDQSEAVEGQMSLRLASIRALPNQPFNKIISRMGQNGIFAPYGKSFPQFGAGQPDNLKRAMKKWWGFLWAEFGCEAFQLMTTPRAQNKPSSNMAWTEPNMQIPTDPKVDSYPDGSRFQFNNWLLQAGAVPVYVTVIDDRAAFYSLEVPHAWRRVEGEWMLGSAIDAGETQLTFNGLVPPRQGDAFALDPGSPDSDVRTSYRVTGTGPWTVYVTSGGKAHDVRAPIRVVSTTDGLHPAHSLHVEGAKLLIASKLARVLP